MVKRNLRLLQSEIEQNCVIHQLAIFEFMKIENRKMFRQKMSYKFCNFFLFFFYFIGRHNLVATYIVCWLPCLPNSFYPVSLIHCFVLVFFYFYIQQKLESDFLMMIFQSVFDWNGILYTSILNCVVFWLQNEQQIVSFTLYMLLSMTRFFNSCIFSAQNHCQLIMHRVDQLGRGSFNSFNLIIVNFDGNRQPPSVAVVLMMHACVSETMYGFIGRGGDFYHFLQFSPKIMFL